MITTEKFESQWVFLVFWYRICLNYLLKIQEISPGFVETEIIEAGGSASTGENWLDNQGFPYLKDVDVAQTVEFLLMTPYAVNITEIIIKPTGEKFWNLTEN